VGQLVRFVVAELDITFSHVLETGNYDNFMDLRTLQITSPNFKTSMSSPVVT
jgi:hypothetical protein